MIRSRIVLLAAPALLLTGLAAAQSADVAPTAALASASEHRPAALGAPEAALYTNGTFVTQTGVGLGGADVSEIESGSNSFGYNNSQAIQARIADDFAVPSGDTWTLDQLIWHSYQTGAPTSGTLTAITVELLDGAPSLGGLPIAGDPTTNLLSSAVWSGVYRVTSTNLLDPNRAIIDVGADLSFLAPLAAGTYWVSVDVAGSLSSGPWCPPTVPALATDNAEQLFGGGWAPILDPGLNSGHDMWFRLDGTAGGGTGPGTAYCFGVGCPCGNDDPGAGCINSTGAGALLGATGSTSVLADDLTLTGTSIASSSVTLVLMGSQTAELPLFDGKLCVGGEIWRLWKHYNSGQAGTVVAQGVVGLFGKDSPPILIQPGESWNFQMWFRDAPAKLTPCGQKANFTNAFAVTFTP